MSMSSKSENSNCSSASEQRVVVMESIGCCKQQDRVLRKERGILLVVLSDKTRGSCLDMEVSPDTKGL